MRNTYFELIRHNIFHKNIESGCFNVAKSCHYY